MSRKLTYWIARCRNDSQCYSIRAKTKKEVEARFADGSYRRDDFDPPIKVTVEYSDAFDLMDQCMSESMGYWEAGGGK